MDERAWKPQFSAICANEKKTKRKNIHFSPKKYKNNYKLQTKMCQRRLSMLSLLVMESESVKELRCDNFVHEFVE